jgi:Crp-like helix-turn-helix domain
VVRPTCYDDLVHCMQPTYSPAGEKSFARFELLHFLQRLEYVGASLETVVRVLNTLKTKGLLQISGRRIHIVEPGGLVALMEKEEI